MQYAQIEIIIFVHIEFVHIAQIRRSKSGLLLCRSHNGSGAFVQVAQIKSLFKRDIWLDFTNPGAIMGVQGQGTPRPI